MFSNELKYILLKQNSLSQLSVKINKKISFQTVTASTPGTVNNVKKKKKDFSQKNLV